MAPASSSRRPGFPLGLRIFGIAGLVVVLTTGAGLILLHFLGRRGAQEPARAALSSSFSAFTALEQQRSDQLRLTARLLAAEPAVVSLAVATEEGKPEVGAPQPASPGSPPDAQRVAELLADRCKDLSCDLAAIVRSDGTLIARSDLPQAAGQDLSSRPLISESQRDYVATGVWLESGHLFDAATAPVVRDFDLLGYAVAGVAINDLVALEVKRIGRAEVVFLADAGSRLEVTASTLGPAVSTPLLAELADREGDLRELVRRGETFDGGTVPAGGTSYLTLLAPLRNAAGDPVGGVLLAAPLGAQAALAGQMTLALAGVAAAALLLAALLALWVSRSTFGAVRRLTASVERARRGDLAQRVAVRRSDALGSLASVLGGWIADLDQERALGAAVLTALEGREVGEEGAGEGAPETREVALVAIEMRRFASSSSSGDPAEALARLAQERGRIRAAASASGGRVAAALGHRVLLAFSGPDRTWRALATACRLLAELSRAESVFDEVEPPAVVVASGKAVVGEIAEPDGPRPAVVGLVVQQLESLLREAAPGDLLLTRGVVRELEGRLAEAGVTAVSQKAILSPQPLFSLSSEAAARLAGGAPAPDLVPASAGPRPGEVLEDRFEIRSTVGRGPAGTLFLAYDREIGRPVAWKLLDEAAAGGALELERLDGALPSYRRLSHPSVARLYDFGRAGGYPYLEREYVQGLPLRTLLDRTGGLSASAALGASRHLAAALAVVHDEGLFHGRLKPENVFFDAGGTLKVTDFGESLLVPPDGGADGFLSPEQQEGQPPDARSDVFALGVLIRLLFTGGSATAAGQVPEPVAAVLKRCLAAEPDRRYADAGELLRELEAVGG